ncbi:MAG TPA: hypothetical protein VJ180_07660 [Pyrinomonadaceae bacterium]|nr:hypothetical protein [Pyrinomonadaceae bacterium]
MDKGIGFSRTITLDWLDATATLCLDQVEYTEIRERLLPVVQNRLTGKDARRKTIDVLTAIWVRIDSDFSTLRDRALQLFQTATSSVDRLWLHYGMTLAAYPFFRSCAAAIGQTGRLEDKITRQVIKDRLIAEMGHLGGMDRSVERVMASLKEWSLLVPVEGRGVYQLQMNKYSASSAEYEVWLLACALYAHPSSQLPFPDLVRLAELFPFRFMVSVANLRNSSLFDVNLQGGGLEMVRLIIR